jgi:hypothetical protein
MVDIQVLKSRVLERLIGPVLDVAAGARCGHTAGQLTRATATPGDLGDPENSHHELRPRAVVLLHDGAVIVGGGSA